ncbi:hypothetical protein [Geodermatophilus sp. DSM 44513]|uniref:hypothetical protein n=1 Tax=Geodermatophilus sp. DSM 44513 TaxID=1528104 RepID=UPI00126BD0C3|nr:hypothetical protein [Geodermatophilus sp. DSM 44513]WNV76927.1 hypothetical protein RTG05_06530 [Geodermatophilus sp. DSM 44513]
MAELSWIGWVLALLGLLAGFIYFRLNRKVKRIEWKVGLDSNLISLHPGTTLHEHVTVNVGNETLKHPRVVIVTVKNTGNVGLSTKTMYRPFSLVVDEGSEARGIKMVRIRAGHTDQEDLPATFPLKPVITIPDTLLNSGDEVRCSLLIDGVPNSVSLVGEAEDFVIKGRREPSQEVLVARIKLLQRASLITATTAVVGSASSGVIAYLSDR